MTEDETFLAKAIAEAMQDAAKKINDDLIQVFNNWRPVGNPLTHGEPYAVCTEYGFRPKTVDGSIVEIDPEQKALSILQKGDE